MERRHSHHQFITLGGTLNRPKYTTRHLAALNFLLNVPMVKEQGIVQSGIENAKKMQQAEESEGMDENNVGSENRNQTEDDTHVLRDNLSQTYTGYKDEQENDLTDQSRMNIHHSSHLASDEFLMLNSPLEAAGKKLSGPHSIIARYPPSIRYKLATENSGPKQWEESLLHIKDSTVAIGSTTPNNANQESSILDNRIFFSRARSYPTMVYSIIKFDAKEERLRKEKLRGVDDQQKALKVYELPHRDWRGFSYKPLFKQLTEELQSVANPITGKFDQGFLYDPKFIDDPEMLYGCHKYVLQKSASTGPIMSSIILYVNKHELKVSLNDQFHQRHPTIPISLTLSKIRKLKKDILTYALAHEIELTTVAIAIINFERLVMKGLVSKVNRRLSMAVAFILAIKFNESPSSVIYRKLLDDAFNYFDKEWDLSKKQIFEAEFGVYVALGFLLHIPCQHITYIYNHLLTLCNLSTKQYLKEEMYDVFLQDIMTIETSKESYKDYGNAFHSNGGGNNGLPPINEVHEEE
jgi:hypothetical protein